MTIYRVRSLQKYSEKSRLKKSIEAEIKRVVVSIVVSIPACHAGDPGDYFSFFSPNDNIQTKKTKFYFRMTIYSVRSL